MRKVILIVLFLSVCIYSNEIEIYKKACEEGIMSQCVLLGMVYENNKKIKIDEIKKLYNKACLFGNIGGCDRLGYIYAKESKIDMAYKYYKIACDRGNSSSCYSLLKLKSEYGNLKLKDKVELLKKSCSYVADMACVEIGTFYLDKNNTNRAKEYFKKACKFGNSIGCFGLGSLYENENNTKEAEKYYKKSCEMGYSNACVSLADYYVKFKKDIKNSLKLYKNTCDKKMVKGVLI